MEDLTVFEDNDHLGTFVRGGQEPSQSLTYSILMELCDMGMGKYQIKDKDEG